ncbi:MAG: M20/M25/M40 family metallo-hydrolase [Thermoplasmata archaeon]|nr:MAG: M20/M25/M40 family metallo-hydrolase [Thermoplasmata archaeon]
MKGKIIACIIAICFSLSFHPSCKGNEVGGYGEILEEITEETMREYIQMLQGFGPRVTGTEACREAAEYIASQFQEYGLSVRYHSWEYGGYEDINVEGTLEGVNESSDEIYIVCAHYDSVPGSPGADDNGSGTAAVLAAANVLSNYKFEHTIRFVTFSGEEEGLLGSHEYASEARSNGDNIVGVINADMIGYTRGSIGMTHVWAQEIPSSMWITNISINVSNVYSDKIELELVREESHPYSDHHSFISYGYDAIFFIEYEFNDYYHSSEDTIDKMDLDYAARVTRLIVGTLIEMAELLEGDWEKPQVSVEKPMQGYLYLQNKEIIPLPFGMTVVLGGIEIEAYASDNESGVRMVEFYIDGNLKFIDEEPPYTYMWDEHAFLTHNIEVRAYDNAGNMRSAERKCLIFNL